MTKTTCNTMKEPLKEPSLSSSSRNNNHGNNRHPMASHKGFLRGTFLFVQAMITVPVYSMLFWAIFYFFVLAYAVKVNNLSLLSILFLYSTYILLDQTPRSSTRGWPARFISSKWQSRLRSYPGFIWLAQYFDGTLIKTTELDPNRPYIFCYHPHGIIGIGSNTMLATNGADFETQFPGIKRRAVTLNAAFLTPFFRDWMLAVGLISANKSTLKETLAHQSSIILVPGGAAEALNAHPNTMKLHLKHRKGFVRLAMERTSKNNKESSTTASLIPCIGFGENEIFSTLATTKTDTGWKGLMWQCQQACLRFTSISPPIITNPIPRPVKLSVVVGAPLDMDLEKSVDENHAAYLEALQKLYKEHATSLGYGHVKLEIV